MVRLIRIALAIGIAAITAANFSSCTKSEFNGPILVNDPVNLKRTFTINPGESANLTTKFDAPESLKYEWSINDEKIDASGSSYNFTTSESGTYIITQRVFNDNGEVFIDYYVAVRGAYDKGTFIFSNSDKGAGLTYISKDLETVNSKVFAEVNPDKTLGTRISSVQAYNGKLYILSASEGLIVLNSITLKEINRVKSIPANANFFLPIDRATALLSTDDGIYQVNLKTLAVGAKIPGIGGRVGLMANTENHVQVLTLGSGMISIDKSKLTISKLLRVGRSGLAKDLSNNVWTSYKDTLFSISPSFNVSYYKMSGNLQVASSWNPWNEGTMCTSTATNSLFFVRANTNGLPSGVLMKFDLSTLSNSTTEPFVTLPEGRVFSGIGLRIDSENNIVATTTDANGGTPEMVVYRAGNAQLVKRISIPSADACALLFNNVK